MIDRTFWLITIVWGLVGGNSSLLALGENGGHASATSGVSTTAKRAYPVNSSGEYVLASDYVVTSPTECHYFKDGVTGPTISLLKADPPTRPSAIWLIKEVLPHDATSSDIRRVYEEWFYFHDSSGVTYAITDPSVFMNLASSVPSGKAPAVSHRDVQTAPLHRLQAINHPSSASSGSGNVIPGISGLRAPQQGPSFPLPPPARDLGVVRVAASFVPGAVFYSDPRQCILRFERQDDHWEGTGARAFVFSQWNCPQAGWELTFVCTLSQEFNYANDWADAKTWQVETCTDRVMGLTIVAHGNNVQQFKIYAQRGASHHYRTKVP